jgi:hypothetical protein
LAFVDAAKCDNSSVATFASSRAFSTFLSIWISRKILLCWPNLGFLSFASRSFGSFHHSVIQSPWQACCLVFQKKIYTNCQSNTFTRSSTLTTLSQTWSICPRSWTILKLRRILHGLLSSDWSN